VPGSGRPPWRPDLQNLIANELREAHAQQQPIDYGYIRECFKRHLVRARSHIMGDSHEHPDSKVWRPMTPKNARLTLPR